MNYNKLFITILILYLLVSTSPAQINNDFPKLVESDFPGSRITREQIFDGGGLWGYINGGADLFLEYGFDKLFLQEIEIDTYRFKIEFYKMNTIEAAFGVYSVSHFKCEDTDTNIKYNCITPFQIQTAISNYYISIINKNGSKEEQTISKKLWSKLISKIPKIEFTPPTFFTNKKLLPILSTMKYFNGNLAIQNGIYDWYDRFEKLSDCKIYLLLLEVKSVIIYLSQISFSSEDDLNSFLKSLSINFNKGNSITKKEEKSVSYIVKALSPKEIIFIEGSLKMNELDEVTKKLF